MSRKNRRFLLPVMASSLFLISAGLNSAFAESLPDASDKSENTTVAAASTKEAKSDASESTAEKVETKEPSKAEEEKPKGPTKAEKVEMWGDSNIAIKAGNAARAMKLEKYSAAVPNFKALIGFNDKNDTFHIGLYYAASKAENWNQAWVGLEELFEYKPEYKKKLAKQFAEVLRNIGEDEEAAEYDKLVTKSSGDGAAFVEKTMKDFIEKAYYVEEEYKPPEKFKVPTREKVRDEDVHIQKTKYGLTYKNMFQRSEKILIARYDRYEDDGSISYFAPPKAIFKVEEILKGSKLNPTIYIRFEFHNKLHGVRKPKGWKFDPSMMPKKGSKWLIFIPNAIPVDGMYETYKGKFGIQPFNEDNYDKIMRILEKHKGQTR